MYPFVRNLTALPVLALVMSSSSLAGAAGLDDGCKAGQASDCYALATAYRDGVGVSVDLVRAAALFGQVCDAGFAQACFDCALMFQSGNGVERNQDRATALFRRACDGGAQQGCDAVAKLVAPPASQVAPASVDTPPKQPVETAQTNPSQVLVAPAGTPELANQKSAEPAAKGIGASARPTWEPFAHLGFVGAFTSGSNATRFQMDKSGGLMNVALGATAYTYFALGAEAGWLMFGNASPADEQKVDASVSLTYGGLFAGLRSPPIITGEGGFRLGANIGHDWISGTRSYSYAGDSVTCGSGGCSSTHHDSVGIGGGNFIEGFVAYGFAKVNRSWVGGIALAYREFFDGGLSRMVAVNFGVF